MTDLDRIPHVLSVVGGKIGCNHCWHNIGVAPMAPPIHLDVCCWCGAEQRIQYRPVIEDHGIYHPARRL